MAITDIMYVLQWWGILFGIGVAFMPLASILFKQFPDRGYVFAKTIGLILLSYVAFLLGLLHITPLSQIEGIVLILISFVLCYIFLPKKNAFLPVFKSRWKFWLFEEILFLLGLFFLSYIRSFAPDIHGLEKYMDYGFINSILRSPSFPPKDMWLTPFTINYYYFGHLITAFLTKLSGIPANITFNLMLATVFSLCFGSSFSIGSTLFTFAAQKVHFYNLRLLFVSLLSAFLVTMGGNLHTLYTLFLPYQNDHPVPPWRLSFSLNTFPNAYWYPNATRFIYNTIHEFPMYSWVVSDLHGHVLDIPIVLLTIALIFSVFVGYKEVEKKKRQTFVARMHAWSLVGIPQLLSVGFLLAVMYMTNVWDGIIYFLLTVFVLFVLNSSRIWHVRAGIVDKLYTVITDTGFPAILLFLSFIFFSLPFSIFFKPFASGIGVLCAPKVLTNIGKIGPFLFEVNHCQKSPWWQLLILYGFFYFFVISFLLFIRRRQKTKADMFVLILVFLSTLLIIIPEFVYVKDIYPAHYRANTMFKLVFQAFIMLMLSTGFIIHRILASFRTRSQQSITSLLLTKLGYLFWIILACLLFLPVAIYPYFGITSYYNSLSKYTGLDGTAYLKTLYPTDYAAIQWIQKNIHGQPVMLEAQGDSYTDYARISANTGLPTVLGWTVHEWLWHGSYDLPPGEVHDPNKLYVVPAPRIPEVQTLYETTDLKEAKRLIKKYHIQYIFIGSMEYQKYPNLSEDKFKKLGKLIYKNGGTKIYELSQYL